MPDKKTVVGLISVLSLTAGIFLSHYLEVYKPETDNPHNAEEMRSSQNKDNDVSNKRNDMQEQKTDLTASYSKSDEIAQDDSTQDHSGCKTDALPDENTVMQSNCQVERDENYIEDIQSLKEQVKDILEKQTKTDLNKIPGLELENAVLNLKTDFHNQMKHEIEIYLSEMKTFYNAKLANVSTTLNKLDNKSKAGLNELQMSLSNLTVETQETVRELHQWIERMYTKIEEDFAKKMQDVDEQLSTIQHTLRTDDKRINDLQYLIENRIFPNTFNKGIAIGVFLVVVVIVLVLVLCLCCQHTALQGSRSEIDKLKKKFEELQAQTDTAGRNEVPGRIK